MSELPPTINFDYIKSNFFRAVHADGVWGGINGHLDVVMAFFSERPAIPQRLVFELDGHALGKEVPEKRVGRDSTVREVEVSVSMNADMARSLHAWLGERIGEIDSIKNHLESEKK